MLVILKGNQLEGEQTMSAVLQCHAGVNECLLDGYEQNVLRRGTLGKCFCVSSLGLAFAFAAALRSVLPASGRLAAGGRCAGASKFAAVGDLVVVLVVVDREQGTTVVKNVISRFTRNITVCRTGQTKFQLVDNNKKIQISRIPVHS